MTASLMTARELLARVAGKKHELHSIVKKVEAKNLTIEIQCSCGDKFNVDVTAANLLALRNVSEGHAS